MVKNIVVCLVMVSLWALTLTPIRANEPANCQEDYIIQSGDSLSQIAEQYYHDPLAYTILVTATQSMTIFDESYASITDANLIEVGWKLCIPSHEDPKTRLIAHAPLLENYAVYQNISLTQALHGITGTLQLLQDDRLIDANRAAMWAMGDINYPLEFQDKPLQNGLLRLIDLQGHPIMTHTLEYGLAKLEQVNLYNSHQPTYLLTVDYSAGFGSYSGPVTFFVEVASGKLEFLKAVDQQTGVPEAIMVMNSLKTAWKIVPATPGKNKNILQVESRLDLTSKDRDKFNIIYQRFHFNGHNWVKCEHVTEGIWEWEGRFPDVSLFP